MPDTETAVAIYAAALSTATAIVGLGRLIRDRPKIVVHAALSFTATSSDSHGRGTLVEMHEPGLMYESLLALRVINGGRRAVEIVAVLIEGFDPHDPHRISVHEVRPAPLPAVVEPLSTVETSIQKEHLDDHEALLFLGVVDALGRRHPADDDEVRRLLVTNQSLPTNVNVFQRRDDPSKKITAWQVGDPTALLSRDVRDGRFWKSRDQRRIAAAGRRGWPRPVAPDARAKRAARQASS